MTKARFEQIEEMLETRRESLTPEALSADCNLAGDDHDAWCFKAAIKIGVSVKELKEFGITAVFRLMWPNEQYTHDGRLFSIWD